MNLARDNGKPARSRRYKIKQSSANSPSALAQQTRDRQAVEGRRKLLKADFDRDAGRTHVVAPASSRRGVSRMVVPAFSLLLCFVVSITSSGEAALGRAAVSAAKPKVRAITAFVHLDRAHYQQQVAAALDFLRKTKSAFEGAGYQLETVRITTQPFPEYIGGLSREEALRFFKEYDSLAEKENFDASIGPAMTTDTGDPRQTGLLAEIIQNTKVLEGSVIVASDDGVHWVATQSAARLIRFLSEHTARSQGNFRFAATALVPPGTPFYPASYHTGQGHQFAVALESANVAAEVFRTHKDPAGAQQALITTLGREAMAIETIAQQAAKDTGWTYLGLDDSPAPLKDVSIGGAIEEFTGAPIGSSGTMTAVATITGALKAIPVKRIGYSGLMLPILEDSVLAQRWSEGTLHLDSLLAYSAICGTGLDTIPLPGDITEQKLARLIGDVATLAVKLHKPLSARLLPVAGKKPGERTEFDDPFLVNATIQALP